MLAKQKTPSRSREIFAPAAKEPCIDMARSAFGEEASCNVLLSDGNRLLCFARNDYFAIFSAASQALCSVRDPSNAVVMPNEDEDLLVDDDIGTRIGEPWKVVLYNDDIHTFDEVILQLQKAIGCTVQRAEQIAFEAHTKGKAIAFNGEFNECFRVMGILREIQLIVEIEG
jgi:ATP-dependent Clp protease adapter protein ClpS